MKIHIVTATWPPVRCGIADHTARIAHELSAVSDVKVLTAKGVDSQELPGGAVENLFSLANHRDVYQIYTVVKQDQPDWLLVQYDPYSFDASGRNLLLPLVVQRLRREMPTLRIAIIVHEIHRHIEHWKHYLSRSWTAWSLLAIGKAADVIMFSIEPWAVRYKGWFPTTTVLHLPVPSNMAEATCSKQVIRSQIGVNDNQVVLGVFGRVSPSLSLELIQSAADAVTESGKEPLIMYIGTQYKQLSQIKSPMLNAGYLTEIETANHFKAMDVYLLPFKEGISTRRTSLMTGLQQSIPIVGTKGSETDDLLLQQNGEAFIVTPTRDTQAYKLAVKRVVGNASLGKCLGTRGRELYEQKFSSEAVAAILKSILFSAC